MQTRCKLILMAPANNHNSAVIELLLLLLGHPPPKLHWVILSWRGRASLHHAITPRSMTTYFPCVL